MAHVLGQFPDTIFLSRSFNILQNIEDKNHVVFVKNAVDVGKLKVISSYSLFGFFSMLVYFLKNGNFILRKFEIQKYNIIVFY